MNNNVSQLVIKYAQVKDIPAVRSALTSIAYSDHVSEFVRFKASYEYAVAEVSLENLFEPHKNELPMIYSPGKKLTVTDYKESASNLMENFSKERVNDVLRTGEIVFGAELRGEQGRNQQATPSHVASKKAVPPHQQEKIQTGMSPTKKKFLIGAVIVGVGIIIAATVINSQSQNDNSQERDNSSQFMGQ